MVDFLTMISSVVKGTFLLNGLPHHDWSVVEETSNHDGIPHHGCLSCRGTVSSLHNGLSHHDCLCWRVDSSPWWTSFLQRYLLCIIEFLTMIVSVVEGLLSPWWTSPPRLICSTVEVTSLHDGIPHHGCLSCRGTVLVSSLHNGLSQNDYLCRRNDFSPWWTSLLQFSLL